MVFSHEVDVVFLGVIYYFMKPNYIGVLQCFKNFELFLNLVVGTVTSTIWHSTEVLFAHLFNCVNVLSLCVLALVYCGKLAFSKSPYNFILINNFLFIFETSLNFCRAWYYRRTPIWFTLLSFL